jgi:ribose 5-phosphate isomerase B
MGRLVKKILIASDHAGFELKEILKTRASEMDVQFVDLGTGSLESVDYPDYANLLSKKLIEIGAEENLGILICGSGVGVSIAANRHPQIRAVLAESETTAQLAREHNHANVLCLGARTVTTEKAISIIKIFITTLGDPGPRHLRRIKKLGEC